MELSALYLPQFHQIPENDEWWGEGFTEWTNVKRARPLFRGHAQPVVPGELGYYSLLDPEIRERQAELAKLAGITSFCYWHYWFGGREILERPLREVVASGSPDFPFFVGWANQSWSGVWHGLSHHILIEQTYPGIDDHRAHLTSLLPTLTDPRYVTIGGKPVMLIFRPTELPNARQFVDEFQQVARELGLPGLYLVAWLEGREWGVQYTTHDADGFDGGLYVEFPFTRTIGTKVRDRLRARNERFGPARYRYTDHLPQPREPLSGRLHQSVQPNWDNTPRSTRRGAVATSTSPERFERQLTEALVREKKNPSENQLVIVKSWNEWAEGNYLEPDVVHGRGWLDAVHRSRRAAGVDQ
jgi:lipopolysaccharide biosynthesis protein